MAVIYKHSDNSPKYANLLPLLKLTILNIIQDSFITSNH